MREIVVSGDCTFHRENLETKEEEKGEVGSNVARFGLTREGEETFL